MPSSTSICVQLIATSVSSFPVYGRDSLTTVFPSLSVSWDEVSLGFLSFGGYMAGWEAPSVGRCAEINARAQMN